jgi:hypothetical protein
MRRFLVWLGLAVAAAALFALLVLVVIGRGTFGQRDGGGEVQAPRRASSTDRMRAREIAESADAIAARRGGQILFGDLHVHSTLYTDAFQMSLPMNAGEGAHPPADACDFARHCSALDFWSINDHAELLTTREWRETVEVIRQCNEIAGDPADPDVVAFLGWEWTNMSNTPEKHFGHKNVVLAGIGERDVPVRPIAAPGPAVALRRPGGAPNILLRGMLGLLGGHPRYHDLALYLAERGEDPACESGVHVKDLPASCVEIADDPAELFRKLDEWDVEAIVIPHGTTWGFYTPPEASWDKQLAGPLHDPQRQRLIEVYSGHGDSEVHRDWRPVEWDAEGKPVCPAPRPDYLPTCWQAGEIIRGRCLAEGLAEQECGSRAAEARALALAAGQLAHVTVPAETPEEWLDAGQCRDCAGASFNYRPTGSAQYILALSDFGTGADAPRRFRMGFIASSDNHFARPGTGYKEIGRIGNTESFSRRGGPFRAPRAEPPAARAHAVARTLGDVPDFQTGLALYETERQASFFMTGGLVAVHAESRDRASIWDALERKQTYGTSGPRILLWFDLLNPPGPDDSTSTMGSEHRMAETPRFRVRALGSLEQQPGCPDETRRSLGAERLARLCKGECYNPGDRRRLITRIEIVRVRPQASPGEAVGALIEDPWRRYVCQPDPAGCTFTFGDPEFTVAGRDSIYYARVFEEPVPAINAGGIRCTRDPAGRCLEAKLCPGPDGDADECLSRYEPRAWSSPIYIDFAAPGDARTQS